MKKLGVSAPSARRDFARAASFLPDLDLSASDAGREDGSVTISIKRLNELRDREGRVYAPRFPKPQSEGYFVITTLASTSNVLGLKRANWPGIASGANTTGDGAGSAGRSGRARGGKLEATVRVKIPDEMISQRDMVVDVLVMSDAYPGMEWRLRAVKVPQVVRVEDEPPMTMTVNVDESLIKGKGKAVKGG